jgi:hypothetical protein
MKSGMMLGAAAFACVLSSPIYAQQSAAPTYQADPSVYKVIFEDQNFRVILSERKAGAKDKEHSHPVPGVGYYLTDCQTRLHTPDGKTREGGGKEGVAHTIAQTPAHSAENFGTADCRELIIERKQ